SPSDEVHLTPHEDVQVAMPADAADIFAGDEPRRGSSKKTDSKSDIILVAKEGEMDLLASEDEGPASSSFVFPTSKKAPGAGKVSPPPTHAELEVPDDGGFAIGGDEAPTTAGDSQVRLDSLSGRLPDSGVRLVDFDLPSQLSGLMPPPPSSRKMPKSPSTVDLLRPGGMPGAPGSGKTPPPSAQPPKSGKVPGSGKTKQPLPEIPGVDPAAAAQLANLSPTDSGSESALSPGLSLSDFELEVTKNEPGDSVFDLTGSQEGAPSLELELTSELDVGGDDDMVDVSGGSRQKPDAGGTMRGKVDEVDESSGTFELSLDSDEFSTAMAGKPGSSEFDLSIDADQTDSSDFELTLEEDSGMDSSGEMAASIEVRPDQMETSDFELALDEDSSSEILDETTDSEVVVIEDEEGGVGVADMRAGVPIEDDDLVVEEAVDEEPALDEATAAAAAAPAEWGYWSLTLVPTVLIMPIVGFLLFEMLRSVSSYQDPGVVTGPIYSIIRDMTK
ncbi:MAG TPA: hypothetical protein PKC45_10585, partial [Gemmatales bacterium]|nr:hypothetical protein [Gemmatales bacterium]